MSDNKPVTFDFTATGRDLESVSTLALANLARENGNNLRFIHGTDKFSVEVGVQDTPVASGGRR